MQYTIFSSFRTMRYNHSLMQPQLTIIIPVLNEEEVLPHLWERLQALARVYSHPIQFVFVDDGSTDKSWDMMTLFACDTEHITCIRLKKNCGKSIVYTLGFAHATAPIIATIDADLQDDPFDIPYLVKKLESGYDLVMGWRKERCDLQVKRFSSSMINWITRSMCRSTLHDMNCGLKVMTTHIAHRLVLHGGLYRFLPVLAAMNGARVTEHIVHHSRRTHGVSKYGKYGILRRISAPLDLLRVVLQRVFKKRTVRPFDYTASIDTIHRK